MDKTSVTSEEETGELVIPTECYTRCVGYLRPTSAFNQGKAQEVSERRMFDVSRLSLSADASPAGTAPRSPLCAGAVGDAAPAEEDS